MRAQDNRVIAAQLRAIQEIELSDEALEKVCELMKERATFAQDILTEGAYLFDKPTSFDTETIRKKWKSETTAYIQEWQKIIKELSDFSAASIETAFKTFLTEKELGIGAVLLPYRLVLTGVGAGPGMFDISAFLGKEEVLERITLGLQQIERILNEA